MDNDSELGAKKDEALTTNSHSISPLEGSAEAEADEDLLLGSELSLADLENTTHPILDRVQKRLLNEHTSHSSHSSGTGRGHNSYVSGRFEDSPTVDEK